MKVYLVQLNTKRYEKVEAVFSTYEKAVSLLEDILGAKACGNNIWRIPSNHRLFSIEEYEVEEKTDEIYIVKFSTEDFNDKAICVYFSREDAVGYIEQHEDLRYASYNLWHCKESIYKYWEIEKQKIL